MIPSQLQNQNQSWDWVEDTLGLNVNVWAPWYGIFGHGLTNGQRVGVLFPQGGLYGGTKGVYSVEVLSGLRIRIPAGSGDVAATGKLFFFDPDGQSAIPILSPIGPQANDVRQVPSGSLPGTSGGLDPFNTSVLISDLSSRGNADVDKLVGSEERKCFWCWVVIVSIVSWVIWRQLK